MLCTFPLVVGAKFLLLRPNFPGPSELTETRQKPIVFVEHSRFFDSLMYLLFIFIGLLYLHLLGVFFFFKKKKTCMRGVLRTLTLFMWVLDWCYMIYESLDLIV
jgi:hypothetical protein